MMGLTGARPLSPGSNHKICPVQPTRPCMHHAVPWLVVDGCRSQDLCLMSV
jgi:hypothetical protein